MIDFSSQKGINALALFQSGQALAKQQQAEKALGTLAVDPNDNSAFARLAQYDPEKAYQISGQRQAAQQQARVSQVVQQAVTGDPAANNALAGLDPSLWAKIQPAQRANIERQNAVIGQLALAADTPEKWAVAIQQARAQGIDVAGHEDFSQRNVVLAQAGQLDDWIKSQEPHYIPVGEGGVVNVRDPQALSAVASGNVPSSAGTPDLAKMARDAIAAGADPAAVRARMQQLRGGAPSQGGATFP